MYFAHSMSICCCDRAFHSMPLALCSSPITDVSQVLFNNCYAQVNTVTPLQASLAAVTGNWMLFDTHISLRIKRLFGRVQLWLVRLFAVVTLSIERPRGEV